MDAVSYCVSKIRQHIPRQLLDEAFKPQRYDPIRSVRRYDNVLSQSLDDLIRTKIMEGMVGIDLEQIAGTEDLIPVSMAERIPYDPWNVVYRFNKKDLGGRNIIKVHEILLGYNLGFGVGGYGEQNRSKDMLTSVARDISRATVGVESTGSAYVELIGPNTVLVNDINIISGYTSLRCTLTYDKLFNEIKPAYRRDLAALSVLAAKAYIYNHLVIDVDEGVIRAGKTLGSFKQTLDKYEDSIQMYEEMIDTTISKIAIMNDTEQYRKVMKLALGSRPKY